MTAQVEELVAASIAKLDLPEDAKRTLVEITANNADAWRATVLDLNQRLAQMMASLERMQTTLNVLVEAIRPELKEKLPAAFSIASDAASADVARALVVADPIAAGFTLSQKDLAQRLGISQPNVSILARAFELDKDPACAVVVRSGEHKSVVNYHPNAVRRFGELVVNPPRSLNSQATTALKSVRKTLVLAATGTSEPPKK